MVDGYLSVDDISIDAGEFVRVIDDSTGNITYLNYTCSEAS